MRTLRKALGAWLVAAVVGAIGVTSFAKPAEACVTPYVLIGQICTFAFPRCPAGFAQAAGQLLPVNNNQALFSLIGNTYGGNGITTFALPDLRGRTGIGTGQGIAGNAFLPNISLGETGGGVGTVDVISRATGTAVDAQQLPWLGVTYCIALTGSFPTFE